MTKELLKQALEAGLESDNPYIRQLAANAVRKARVQPVQEQQQARVDVITVNLMREGINKHRARELADHFVNFTLPPPLPVQEPVAWVTVEGGVWVSTRSADFRHIADGQYQLYAGPLQNDVFAAISTLKAIGYVYDNGKFCKEGEQWIAPTASQPPLPVQEPVAWMFQHEETGRMNYVSNDGIHNPTMFLEMNSRYALVCPLYTASPLPVQEQQQVGPVEDMLLRRAVLRSAKIVSGGRFVTKQAALEQPPLPVQEPVTWDKPSDSFNEWWDSDRRRDNANPFTTDSFAYWAYEGWQAALAQPVQEPLAWLYPEGLKALQNGKCWTAYPTEHEDCNTPLYIAMPPMPVQEPVAWMCSAFGDDEVEYGPHQECENCVPLYTTPPQRQWVGLTASEILNMMPSTIPADYDGELMEFARAIEQTLKEKNHD